MKIRSIELAGLWSYREPQRVDIADIPLLIGVGQNGAGKSTLLVSSIAAAFFGKFPTKTIEESISTGAAQGSVAVEFEIAGAVYRVTRTYPRTGTASGVVMVADEEFPSGWRPVTERGVREVNTYMSDLLGMSYETATMTWLAEQGQYGKFASASPADRFKLLSTVFGLDEYAVKAKAATEKLRAAEQKVTSIDGGITELIDSMLIADEENQEHDEIDLLSDVQLVESRDEREAAADKAASELAELDANDPANQVATLSRSLLIEKTARESKLAAAQADLHRAESSRTAAESAATVARGAAEARHSAQKTSASRRTAAASEAAQAAHTAAEAALELAAKAETAKPVVEANIDRLRDHAAAQRQEQQTARDGRAAAESAKKVLAAEWQSLKASVLDCEARIETLNRTAQDADHAACFACGQHLSAADAAALIASQQGDIARFRARQEPVKAEADAHTASILAFDAAINAAETAERDADAQLVEQTGKLSRITAALADRNSHQATVAAADAALANAQADEFDTVTAADAALAEELAAVDSTLAAAIAASVDLTTSAQAAVEANSEPTAAEVELAAELAAATEAADGAAEKIAARRAELTAARDAERNAARTYDREIARRAQIAEARAADEARLAKLRTDREAAEAERVVFETLVKAFSPTGIPAMILGSAMQTVELSVNDALQRLSRGTMQVQIAAARERSNGSVENKVTIFAEIAGDRRAYETLSSGERFRLDLAVRRGLTDAVSRGTGTPVEAFILDEGFGVLDEAGIRDTLETLTRLSETTQVITVSHIDSVKHAVQSHVEVSTATGTSIATVVR